MFENEQRVLDMHTSLSGNDRFSLETLDEVWDGKWWLHFELLRKDFWFFENCWARPLEIIGSGCFSYCILFFLKGFFIFEKIFDFVAKTVNLTVYGAKAVADFMWCNWLLFEVVVSSLLRSMLFKCYMLDLLSILSLNKPMIG